MTLQEENEKLREALRRIADLPIDPCSTENDYRLSGAKAIAEGALYQQAEPTCSDERPCVSCFSDDGACLADPAPGLDDGRSAFQAYLNECAAYDFVPSIAGAFHFAWQARRSQPEQEPFWYAVVSEQAPTINSAIKRLDVAQEFADSKRERWPDTRVVPLYTTQEK